MRGSRNYTGSSPVTGRLSLASADPFVAPRIELNYLADPRDTARMLEAWRIGRELCRTQPLASFVERLLVDDASPVEYGQPLAVIE